MLESRIAQHLRQRRAFWFHGICIGTLTLLVTWGASALQMHLGGHSLALRYLISLGLGYIVFLVMVRIWAAALLRRSTADDVNLDLSGVDLPLPGGGGANNGPGAIRSGGGGDFGGGGATGDFSGGFDDVPEGVGEMAGGAMEAAASSDEAAVVVVPVVAVFLIGLALVFGAGALMLLYFGWEVLLVVAVELAFSYAAARTSMRVSREGWASAAVRLTWKPLAGAVMCAVMLGATIDYFMPQAQSLPQAIKALGGR
jgi:uncharacterized membrane protein YgcG